MRWRDGVTTGRFMCWFNMMPPVLIYMHVALHCDGVVGYRRS